MSEATPLLVLSSCPDAETAERLATLLVERRLAACVNIVPAITSIYRWQGAVEKEAEVLLLLKTTEERWDELQSALCLAHPYDVPEVIAVPLTLAANPYVKWLREAVEEKSTCAG